MIVSMTLLDRTPAVARAPTVRARTTNDPLHVPGLAGNSAAARRQRDLVSIFIEAVGGPSAVSELQLIAVRRAAELTATAEMVRAAVLSGVSADYGTLIRLESESRRAVRALGIGSPAAVVKPGAALAKYLAEKQAAAGATP